MERNLTSSQDGDPDPDLVHGKLDFVCNTASHYILLP